MFDYTHYSLFGPNHEVIADFASLADAGGLAVLLGDLHREIMRHALDHCCGVSGRGHENAGALHPGGDQLSFGLVSGGKVQRFLILYTQDGVRSQARALGAEGNASYELARAAIVDEERE